VLVGAAAATAWADDSPVRARAGGVIAGDRAWAWWFVALLAVAFIGYLAGLALLRRRRVAAPAVVAVALAVQLAPLGAPLLLSSDAWTYWGYARLGNPYDERLDERDDVARPWVGEKWRDTPSVYGPAFSLATEPVSVTESARVAAWIFKAAAALAIVACVLLAVRLGGAFAGAFVGWNPVVAVHAAGGGHNDAWVGALVLGALVLAAGPRRRLAGVAWAVATLVKWVPLVLLPLRALEARTRGRRVSHVAFAATAAVVVAVATLVYGIAWVESFGPLARNADEMTSYALPSRLIDLGVPKVAALVAAGALFLGVYVWLVVQAQRGRARLALAAGLLVVCSPYVAPWYLAWVVPLAAVEEDRAGRALALALSAYVLPQTIV
jgi:alpha-1,6-mannosyltransferase